MVASPLLTTMRARVVLGACLLAAGTASAAPLNAVSRLTVREEGATTVVAIRGTATPTFTVYKLERPERVVVDVSGARLEADPAPMMVGSWAVTQVSAQALGGQESQVVRVLVGFARPSTYRVKAIGNDVVITVIANQPRPAEADLEQAKAQRVVEEQALADARKRRAAEEDRLAAAERALAAADRARAAADEDARKKLEAADKAAAEVTRKSAADADAARRTLAEAEAAAKKAVAEAEQTKRAAAEAAQKVVAEADAATRKASADAEATRRAAGEAAKKALAEADAARKAAAVAEAEATRRAAAVVADAEATKKTTLAEVEAAKVTLAQAEAAKRSLAEAEASARRTFAQAEGAKKTLAEAEAAKRATLAETEAAKRTVAEAEAAKRSLAEAEASARRTFAQAEEAKKTLAEAEAAKKTLAEAEAAKKTLAEAEAAKKTLAQAEAAKKTLAEAEAAKKTLAVAEAESERRNAARVEAARQALADAEAARRAIADGESANAKRSLAEVEAARKALARAEADSEKRTSAQVEGAKKTLAEAEAARKALAVAEAESAKRMQAQVEAAKKTLAEAETARARALADAEAARKDAQVARTEAARKDGQLAREADAARDRAVAEAEAARNDAKLARAELARKDVEVARAEAARAAEVARAEAVRKDAEVARAEAARKDAEVARAEAARKDAETARAEAARKDAETARAEVARKEAQPARAGAQLRDVDYVDRADAGRVVLDVDGNAQPILVAVSDKQATFDLPGVDIPRRMQRALDVRGYDGPVSTISTFTDAQGHARLVVELSRAARPTVGREGGKIVVDFGKPPRVAPAATVAAAAPFAPISYAPPVVGGYGVATTPVTSQTVAQRATVKSQRIDLDVVDADIHNLMRLMAQAGNVDIVVPDDVKASVTVRLTAVPWRQAMEVVLQSKGLWYRQEGRILRVASRKDLDAEDQAERERKKALVQEERPETEIFTLNYANAQEILRQVNPLLSPRGKAVIDDRTNSIVLTDIAGNRAGILRLMRRLDTQTPQIQIEARVVEARSTWRRQLGIQWGFGAIASAATGNPTGLIFPNTVGVAGGATDSAAPLAGLFTTTPNFAVNMPAAAGTGAGGALGFTFGSVSNNFNVALRLSAAEDTGTVRIISAPKITVLNNRPASISQGVSIPISVVSAAGVNTQFVPADLNLTTTPHVSQRDCSIQLDIDVRKNEADFANTGARGDPTILRKEARTSMLIADGETSVIGGIYTRNTGLSYSKVPWFADIPILGILFKNKRENDERTEVLIFLTPRITNKASLNCETAADRR